jgi:hypothetical protein
VYAENVHGKTFAKCSQSSIQKKILMGKSATQAELQEYKMRDRIEPTPPGEDDHAHNLARKYKSQMKAAQQYISVDPADRFKTEQQKAYTDKNIKRLLQKTADPMSPDALAVRDRDYMEYTASLNAQERANVNNFMSKTLSSTDINKPPMAPKFNNYNESLTPADSRRLQSNTVLLSASSSAKGIPVRPYQQFVRPGLIESRVTDSPDTFHGLGEGFKRLFLDTA